MEQDKLPLDMMAYVIVGPYGLRGFGAAVFIRRPAWSV